VLASLWDEAGSAPGHLRHRPREPGIRPGAASGSSRRSRLL